VINRYTNDPRSYKYPVKESNLPLQIKSLELNHSANGACLRAHQEEFCIWS
jgi:hypothetical protein